MSKRILVVDDDELMRRSVSTLLRKCGYEDILTAADGQEGLEKFNEHRPDLTLLDLRMPKMDGLEFLEAVKDKLEEVPVIILSGAGSVDDVISSLQLGAWDYVLKPIGDFSILDHSISKALERAELVRENRRYQEYLEEEVQKRTAELYQAQKMEAIGTLAGGIAHDFNNLLASIIGYTQMAMDGLEAESQPHRDLENVLEAADTATELVRQILTFSRQGETEVQPVQVQEVLRQVIKLIKSTFPSSIEISAEIDEECKPILADAAQLQQVVMNLCTNARQAIPDDIGKIALGLSREGRLPGFLSRGLNEREHGEYLKISVGDNGVGIPKEHLDKIFEPFFTTKAIGQGTGLGLAVVHGIVGNMQGHIHVESSPGQGTEFQIYLPVVNVYENEEEDTPETIPSGSERILLVDDDPRILRILDRILTQLGYVVTAFEASPDALEAFKQHPDSFDLVLTDMTMPKITGKELAVQILAIRPDIPVIMCTGYSETMDSRQAEKLGIRKFIMKPIYKKDLAQAVRNVLDHG